VKYNIPIVVLLLALVFSCKSGAQSIAQNDVPVVVPDAEIVDVVDTVEDLTVPETPFEYEEESGEEAEETEEIEDFFEEPEVEETPIQEEEQESPAQTEEESAPMLPAEPFVPLVQPPPVLPPPAQSQIPEQPPPEQSPVPERSTPRTPPLPPPYLGPAEPESPPSGRQEIFTPAEPELPSLPREESLEIVFSRVVRLTVGQMLEIPFRGIGWVYLGELGNRRGLSYDSRRLDIESGITIGQSFIFRAETAGTYILKFYKQDFIQDYIINDYVQVIVGEADDAGRGRQGFLTDRGRVVAEPRWPFIPEAAATTSEAASPAAAETETETETTGTAAAIPAAEAVAETAPQRTDDAVVPAAPPMVSDSPSVENTLPEEYIRQAKQEFDAGRVEQAIAVLELMKQRYPFGTDEAWWLLGQLYESNSPARDIRLSLEYYHRLVNEYPQSSRVDDARRRIAYLERYYFNIR
jgi:TolA-binding protein